MAKKNKNRQSNKKVMRDNMNIARRSTRLHALQDNRLFHPLPLISRPIITTSLRPALIRNKPQIKNRGISSLSFIPKNALICARRKIRKEVIFAKGNSGSGNRKPRYNQNSMLKCK